jgi:hypothetical protein
MEPSIRTGLTYDDNRFMTVDDKDSAWSAILAPRINFSVSEENKGLAGYLNSQARHYFSDSDTRRNADSTEISFGFGANTFLNTELDEYGFSYSLTRSKTDDTSQDDGVVIDADAISQDATRITTNFGPSWTRYLNEKTSFSISYRHSSLRYKDTLPNSTLVESDADIVTGSFSRSLNENLAGILNMSYYNYRPTSNLDSQTVALTAGLSGNFTETMSGSFAVGGRRTKFDTRSQALTGFCIGAQPGAKFPQCAGGFPVVTGTRNIDDEDDNKGLTFNATFTKRLETGLIGLSATRIATPNTNSSTDSDSGVLNTTLLSIYSQHRLTERLQARLRFAMTDRENITSSGGDSDNRKYEVYSAGLNWQWYPDLTLAATYAHRRNEQAGSSGTATGNSISFTLNYSFRGLRTSR